MFAASEDVMIKEAMKVDAIIQVECREGEEWSDKNPGEHEENSRKENGKNQAERKEENLERLGLVPWNPRNGEFRKGEILNSIK